eukprot:7395650-Karenia_brevis.AAC.1
MPVHNLPCQPMCSDQAVSALLEHFAVTLEELGAHNGVMSSACAAQPTMYAGALTVPVKRMC